MSGEANILIVHVVHKINKCGDFLAKQSVRFYIKRQI